MHYPKVQKYCLMSVQGCFTDFHIDFGGTSVWYHILRGGKVFWLIPPTPQNLEMYENWVLSGKQGDIFLGDKCFDCQRIELKQGNTFIIPSGWIHAVYTPEDTLVFGGNFLHSFNIPMQLNIYSIEDRTRVPAKFRYPFYYEMCWYVLERYLYCQTNISHLTPEFKKYSLGVGLTKADMENIDSNKNGTSNGVDSDTENKEIKEEALEGLWNLLGKLEGLPEQKKCVPVGILNPDALLDDMKTLLKGHVNDDAKLSYTGEPIVKWPKRPSWYQPPTPPPPVIYRPRLGTKPLRSIKRSSISALRRRRVRCKRCAAAAGKSAAPASFCHDMRKFGGPGRMKKGCIMRRLPLPNTARCAICVEGESDESNPSTHSLMECSVCSQIVHRQCNKEPGEGKINKDLPSCWECPNVTMEKTQAQSLPAMRRVESRRAQPLCHRSNAPHREGIGVGARRGTRSGSSSRPTAPPPSQKLLLQHQQNRQRANALELRLKKRIKLERSKMLTKQSSQERSPRSLCSRLPSRLPSRLRSATSRLSQGRGRGSTWAGAPPHPSSPGGRELESEDSSSNSSSSSSSDEEEGQNSGRGLDKENQPQSRREAAKEREEDLSEAANQNGAEEEEDEEESEQDGETVRRKVAVQKPRTRAQRDPSAIVPKLEAIAPQTPPSTIHNQSRVLARPPIRNRGPDPHSSKHARPHTPSGHTDNRERLEDSQKTRPAKLSNGASSSSTPDLPHLRIPLSALQEGGGEAERENGASRPGCEREVWVSVFRYLSRADLCVCMAVCKNWYKWCLDKRLWARIDLSIKRTVTPQALTGIIKRQPITLDLSWTNISKKQLSWLVGRLPGLKDLMLAGCSWLSISALCSSACPLLRSLDLRYADGVKDSQIRDLVTPPGCDNRSQLRNMQCLRLAGLDISDSTLRLVIRHMPHLTKLDISHCNNLTDNSINLLTAVGSSTRNTVTELNLGGCSKLSDTCLKYLRRLACISLLDLRRCNGVSRKACEAFISELSVNMLYFLSDEKLIQRIS
ncbi:hypothetical protein KUCAC02_004892 [Chaenocephalus aceratus]|uniref:Uncharacterized protein n=1 Tax=Chaenocephalus aceratus TaxID=36190 RepID=A0ACB9X1G4_CHAAC|nr:hypothetical protein KUCAC02_004892 [Chaenocephalus aceratus]